MSVPEAPTPPRPLPVGFQTVLSESELAYLHGHGVVTCEQLWCLTREALSLDHKMADTHLEAIDGGLWVIIEQYLEGALSSETRQALEEAAEAEKAVPRSFGILPPEERAPDKADDEEVGS